MPGNKSGVEPEDYAEYKRSQALEVPVRDVQDSDETPEQRTQRYLNRQSETETPDQRTARYLEKARRAGYMTQSPMTPSVPELRNGPPRQPVTTRDDSPPTDMELDDQGKEVRPDLSWRNAGEQLPQRMADAATPHLGKLDPTSVQLAIMKLRNEVDQEAIPVAQWARQNVPGMEPLGQALEYRQRAKDAEAQQRQPVQMEREFSNDEEKQRYLDKVRQAMANAKK